MVILLLKIFELGFLFTLHEEIPIAKISFCVTKSWNVLERYLVKLKCASF